MVLSCENEGKSGSDCSYAQLFIKCLDSIVWRPQDENFQKKLGLVFKARFSIVSSALGDYCGLPYVSQKAWVL